MMKLPLKTDMFLFAVKNSPFTFEQMVNGLKGKHGDERQFTQKLIERYLLSYCGVNVIIPEPGTDEKAENLRFVVTEYGKENMKYLKYAQDYSE